MTSGIYSFPADIEESFQKGYVERRFRRGLQNKAAYSKEFVREDIGMRAGDTVLKHRRGKIVPTTSPRTALSLKGDLDNGLTAVDFTLEQYQVTAQQYAQTVDCNLVQEKAAPVSLVLQYGESIGEAAADSLELLARDAAFESYMGGNSRIRVTTGFLATPTTTRFDIDDIRGFQNVLKEGKMQPVSASNTLAIEIDNGSTKTPAVVTLVAAHGTNVSSLKDFGGISGEITVSALGGAPSAGDSVRALNAPIVYRAGNKRDTKQIASDGLLTLDMILDAGAELESNGVPKHRSTGAYHCMLSPKSLRQLFSDTAFQKLYESLANDPVVRTAQLAKIYGVVFFPTTYAPIQKPGNHAENDVTQTIHRPLITGAESLVRADFEGVSEWASEMAGSANYRIIQDGGLALITRAPLSRLGQDIAMSWFYCGGFVCPTDIGTDSTKVPTANQATHKRCIVLEHAGS